MPAATRTYFFILFYFYFFFACYRLGLATCGEGEGQGASSSLFWHRVTTDSSIDSITCDIPGPFSNSTSRAFAYYADAAADPRTASQRKNNNSLS